MLPPDEEQIEKLLEIDDVHALEKLLEAGIPSSKNFPRSGMTLLQLATARGAIQTLKMLLERGTKIDHRGKSSDGSALYFAVTNNRRECASLLLERHANPEFSCEAEFDLDRKWTPLMVAAWRERWEMMKLLISYGADVNAISKKGVTPVSIAAEKNDLEILKHLHSVGATLAGNTLFGAIENGNVDAAQFILNNGGNPNVQATKFELQDIEEGESALRMAIDRFRTRRILDDPAGEANYRAIVQMLIENGADVNRLLGNRTPLSLATWADDADLVRSLLKAGADPKGECYSTCVPGGGRNRPLYFETALHSAVRKANWEIVDTLLEYGADPKCVDYEGNTSLELVAKNYGKCTRFSNAEIRDLISFVSKLKNARDSISIYVSERLSDSTRQELGVFFEDGCPTEAVQGFLTNDLNSIIQEDSLYDTGRFEEVCLRDETIELLNENPQEEDLQRLNRKLLEDAYPRELARYDGELLNKLEKAADRANAERTG